MVESNIFCEPVFISLVFVGITERIPTDVWQMIPEPINKLMCLKIHYYFYLSLQLAAESRRHWVGGCQGHRWIWKVSAGWWGHVGGCVLSWHMLILFFVCPCVGILKFVSSHCHYHAKGLQELKALYEKKYFNWKPVFNPIWNGCGFLHLYAVIWSEWMWT